MLLLLLLLLLPRRVFLTLAAAIASIMQCRPHYTATATCCDRNWAQGRPVMASARCADVLGTAGEW